MKNQKIVHIETLQDRREHNEDVARALVDRLVNPQLKIVRERNAAKRRKAFQVKNGGKK